MDYLELCDAAMCAPDYYSGHPFGSDADIDWLHARLVREGHDVPREMVATAIQAWIDGRAERARHAVGGGTLRLS